MLKVAPARAATGPIASVKATMNMGGNAVDRPRAADDFATIKARMEELRHRRRAERREVLLEGLIDMGSRALHDRLEPAEPHPDQFPSTGLSVRPFVITVSHCASSGPSGRTIRPLGLI